MSKIKTDYTGKPIPEGYILVPFEVNPLEIEGDEVAAANVRTITLAGKNYKVLYKAIPREWVKVAKSQFNLVQNEDLGHYAVPDSFSMDGTRDEFEWEFAETASLEEDIIKAEEKAEKVQILADALEKLIERSPQLGLAVVLDLLGKKGEEFASEMGVTHNKANDYHTKAHELVTSGLCNIDFESLRTRRSPRHDEYLDKAYKLLDYLLELFH